MASTPKCETNDDQDAAYIIGMVETGEQLFLCAEHGAHFGLTLALRTLDPAEIINTAQALLTPPAANGEGEPAPRPARKRKASKTVKEPADKPAAEGLEEAPAAADDR